MVTVRNYFLHFLIADVSFILYAVCVHRLKCVLLSLVIIILIVVKIFDKHDDDSIDFNENALRFLSTFSEDYSLVFLPHHMSPAVKAV